MKIAAFDPSLTAIGWAISPDGEGWTRGLYCPRGKGPFRLHDALHNVLRLTHEADVVVVEGYAYMAGNQAHQIGELGGVLRLGWHQKKYPVVEIAPPKLKKFATGKGNSAKDLVLAEAIRRLDYQGADHNETDALWLLQMALHAYEQPGAIDLPKNHLTALQGISWPVVQHLEF